MIGMISLKLRVVAKKEKKIVKRGRILLMIVEQVEVVGGVTVGGVEVVGGVIV